MDKGYEPGPIEKRWYQVWEERGYFRADDESAKPAYAIVLPPPNITGSLHLGHALTATLQDILIRFRRMQGMNALWLPGTDHAGIATQMVVERELKKDGVSRHDLGREKFLERVWKWRDEYGRRIGEQHKILGASLDWSRERFTLDPGLSAAVREAFVRLYEEGIVVRGERLINWCTRCHTALSDLEVDHEDETGKLYHIAYAVKGTAGERVVVATTRPETLLGDTAVAVHPDDKRYAALVGKTAVLPINGREVPIIADAYVDPKFGTGVVKITPGHDFNDFAVGKRHNLPVVSIFDDAGRLTAAAGAFVGETGPKARELVLKRLAEDGQLVETKTHLHAVGHCQRCRTVVEPRFSKQWFVRAAVLAKPAIEAVRSGKTKIIPTSWEKTYFHWMENIEDWCISRQLWWGHQIPVWTCPAGHDTVARATPTACATCGSGELKQDPDVLDTWFSSGLWPFSTLGWPERTKALATFYPNSVMETGFDILFFWVARMMMMGIHFMGEVPFRTVFLHAMVRDAQGRKMSKTAGNVIDPEVVTREHGADALRFTLAILAAQGQDIKLAMSRVEGYRHFANKIWNATRFSLGHLADWTPVSLDALAREMVAASARAGADDDATAIANRWMLHRLSDLVVGVGAALEEFRFNDAADAIYHFFWHEFCDWYIELSKGPLGGPPSERRTETQGVLAHTLEVTMRLLHPIMPHLTEEIWQRLPKVNSAPSLMVARYPSANEVTARFQGAVDAIAFLQGVVGAIRNLRAEHNVAPGKHVPVTLVATERVALDRLHLLTDAIRSLAAASPITLVEAFAKGVGTVSAFHAGVEVCIPLAGMIDVAVERARLNKEIDKVKKEQVSARAKIENEAFVARAPADVVERERARIAEIGVRLQKLEADLVRLVQLG
ncbi:MAG: valine--tRNA ligase [Deltaproteobacteria bacterium]|nr:valine--tRNA ligase [Deltaproteobacteria bacterium]